LVNYDYIILNFSPFSTMGVIALAQVL